LTVGLDPRHTVWGSGSRGDGEHQQWDWAHPSNNATHSLDSNPAPSPQSQGAVMVKLSFKHMLEKAHDGSQSKLCSQSDTPYLVQCMLERE